MKDLPVIVALYDEIDKGLDAQRSAARANNDGAGIDRAQTKQRINDQAYFVLAWGQLEAAIDDACRAAIRAGHAHRDWHVRRAWTLYNPDDRRLSGLRFEDRAALVLDASQVGASPYAKTMQYYNVRNQIAHGTLRSERIAVANVVRDFYMIQAAITP